MNLSNVSQIRFNGSDIELIKLNGSIVYEVKNEEPEENTNPYYIEYTVNNTSTQALNGGSSSYKYGLPRIYSSTTSYDFTGYEDIEITLLDGTITTDVTTTCDQVAKVKLWYPESTVAIKFYGSSSYKPVVKTVNYCKTDNFTNMNQMFRDCNKLTELDLSNFDTSNVTTMGNMFYNCNKLTSLDLSNFDTSNVTNMDGMFYSCSRLTSLQSPVFYGSVSFDYSPLNLESALDIINKLATVETTKTLDLSSTTLALLSNEQIAIATNKGWTLS